ncbi:MAG: hypothetical protein HY762_06670 [Planctomycetes bacterium]|nr:hypothetical protein [Planctomycetota bacterium]
MTYRRRYFDGQVSTPSIVEGAITESKIADEAVTSPKIKNATIQTEDIADKAVTLAKLGDDVPAVGIPDNSISAAKLADNAVEKRHIKTASVDTDEIAPAAVTTDKLRDANVTPAKLSFAVPTRPLSPQINTDEIGDAQVTPAKLSFTPVSRPLVPPATPAEMEDRFTINQNLLLLSNLSNASLPNTEIDLSPYVPVGTKYAMVVMTHAGASTILYGYKAQFYTKPTVDPAPLYRLDTGAKDFTNYLNVLVPLDANRKFVTSVYRDGVTTAAELYLMGYIR